MIRLKLCPFCGGRAKLEDMGWPHHVFCTNCFAKVTSIATGDDGENEAIEKWNRRTQQDKSKLHENGGLMMVKVFTPNKNGKIEFTKEELEALLNEVWQDGYSSNRQYWWSSPTVVNVPHLPSTITCDGTTSKGEPPTVMLTTSANGGTDK